MREISWMRDLGGSKFPPAQTTSLRSVRVRLLVRVWDGPFQAPGSAEEGAPRNKLATSGAPDRSCRSRPVLLTFPGAAVERRHLDHHGAAKRTLSSRRSADHNWIADPLAYLRPSCCCCSSYCELGPSAARRPTRRKLKVARSADRLWLCPVSRWRMCDQSGEARVDSPPLPQGRRHSVCRTVCCPSPPSRLPVLIIPEPVIFVAPSCVHTLGRPTRQVCTRRTLIVQ